MLTHSQQNPQVAVVGCGYWGKNLVRNFAQLGSLHMVCDSTPSGLETALQIAPQAAVVSDLQEALRRWRLAKT
jgi:predicted dehydrogenase